MSLLCFSLTEFFLFLLHLITLTPAQAQGTRHANEKRGELSEVFTQFYYSPRLFSHANTARDKQLDHTLFWLIFFFPLFLSFRFFACPLRTHRNYTHHLTYLTLPASLSLSLSQPCTLFARLIRNDWCIMYNWIK